MKCNYPRIYQIILLLVSTIPLCHVVEAKQPDRNPGVYIPVLKNAHTDALTTTRWGENTAAGYLLVSSGAGETWDALDQALTSLGIKPVKKDAQARQWLTDWVIWSYDKKTDSGRSKPGFSFASRNLERHSFLFTVKQGKHPDQAIIIAVDNTRQQEVDITPDGAYSWLEWTAQDPQQDAADSFLKRLQLPIESALATDIIDREEIIPTTAGEFVVTETTVDTGADVVLITVPEAGETAEKSNNSALKKSFDAASQAAEEITRKPGAMESRMPATPASVEKPPETRTRQPLTIPAEVSMSSPSLPADQSSLKAPVSVSQTPDISIAPPRTEESPVPAKNPSVTLATTGLLVRAIPAVTWPALLQALDDLDIPIDQEDGEHYQLLTGWMNATYNKKNHQLVLRSKQGPQWAFSHIDGKGAERHRFRIEMMTANEGTRSIVHAYHIGSEEQVDLTPDSSQTVLSWEERQTHADVALALLRKLRIVIPH